MILKLEYVGINYPEIQALALKYAIRSIRLKNIRLVISILNFELKL